MMTFDDIRKIVRDRLHGSYEARKPHDQRQAEYDAYFTTPLPPSPTGFIEFKKRAEADIANPVHPTCNCGICVSLRLIVQPDGTVPVLEIDSEGTRR